MEIENNLAEIKNEVISKGGFIVDFSDFKEILKIKKKDYECFMIQNFEIWKYESQKFVKDHPEKEVLINTLTDTLEMQLNQKIEASINDTKDTLAKLDVISNCVNIENEK